MTLDLERTQQRLDRFTIIGLAALSLGSFAGAWHQAILDGFVGGGAGLETALLVVSVVGLVTFGVAFTALYLMGRRLDERERAAIGDELAVVLSRRAAGFAFILSFVTAVLFGSLPFATELSGRTVALVIVGVATGALAVARHRAA
jgi:hypothetical protein